MRRISRSGWLLFGMVWVACVGDDRCSGGLYYDDENFSCRPCPAAATYKNGSCECPEAHDFVDHRCIPKVDATMDMPDTGDAASASASCADYCIFIKNCIGDNPLASGAIPDVVAGLHADDQANCEVSCMDDVGDSADPVVTCIDQGGQAAACAGDTTQAGLINAFGVIGDCCRSNSDHGLCQSICGALLANDLAASMVDFCG